MSDRAYQNIITILVVGVVAAAATLLFTGCAPEPPGPNVGVLIHADEVTPDMGHRDVTTIVGSTSVDAGPENHPSDVDMARAAVGSTPDMAETTPACGAPGQPCCAGACAALILCMDGNDPANPWCGKVQRCVAAVTSACGTYGQPCCAIEGALGYCSSGGDGTKAELYCHNGRCLDDSTRSCS